MDNDQTSLKSLDISPTRGDNHEAPEETPYTTDLPSPDCDILDSDGNIISAQKNSSNARSLFCSDDGFTKQLDTALRGLAKDIYLSNALDMTSSSDELLLQYRHYLFCRITDNDAQPLGMLKDRRNSPNGPTAAQKYAEDCFVLQEYINGNTSDLKKLMKKHMMNQSVSQNLPTLVRSHPFNTPRKIHTET